MRGEGRVLIGAADTVGLEGDCDTEEMKSVPLASHLRLSPPPEDVGGPCEGPEGDCLCLQRQD